MKQLIAKLQDLHNNTQCRGTSAASMFRDVADFIQHDLESIIDELHDMDAWQEGIERENALLRRMLIANGIEYRNEVEAQDKQRILNWDHQKMVEEVDVA